MDRGAPCFFPNRPEGAFSGHRLFEGDMTPMLRVRGLRGPRRIASGGRRPRRGRLPAAAGIVLASLALLSVLRAAESSRPSAAKIASLQNQVETRPAGASTWSPATLNQPLFAQDRVR